MPIGTPVELWSGGAGSSNSSGFTNLALPVYAGEMAMGVTALKSLTAVLTSVVDKFGAYTILGPYDSATHRFYFWYKLFAYPVSMLPAGDSNQNGLAITLTNATYARATKMFKIPASTLGIKVASPQDITTAINTGTSAAPASPSSGVLAQADEIILGAIVNDTPTIGEVVTISAPFTAIGSHVVQTNCTLHVGYFIASSTAAQTISGTLTTSRPWNAMLKTFKAGPTADVLRFTRDSAEYDVSGTTPRLTNIRLENDIRGIAPRLAQVRLEADFLQSDVRLSRLSAEIDTKGLVPQTSQIILEVDVNASVRKGRVRPKIIA